MKSIRRGRERVRDRERPGPSENQASENLAYVEPYPPLRRRGVTFFLFTKGLAILGNIVADANVSQFSRAGNMSCGNKFCCSENKCFCHAVKSIFAPRTQILRPKHMFPSLATLGNITRNIVSAKMFPSLARP